MDTLAQLYGRHVRAGACSDKGTVHSYIDVYEELLAPYRESVKCVLEVGVFAGHSLRLWEEYFTVAEVHGVDLCDQPHGGLADLRPMIAEGTHHISLLNAADRDQVEARFSEYVFDVIIDDANHYIHDQIAIYANLKPHLAPGGIYAIEDVADLDRDRELLEKIDPEARVLILDRRHLKNRFDDVLVVIGGAA